MADPDAGAQRALSLWLGAQTQGVLSAQGPGAACSGAAMKLCCPPESDGWTSGRRQRECMYVCMLVCVFMQTKMYIEVHCTSQPLMMSKKYPCCAYTNGGCAHTSKLPTLVNPTPYCCCCLCPQHHRHQRGPRAFQWSQSSD